MTIPLEDGVTDIIGKAQRGLGLSDTELANRIGIELSELDAVKQVKGVAFAEVEKLAKALELGPKSLVRLAEDQYTPSVTPFKTGFLQANTAYGDMTVNAYLVWDPETRLAAAFDTGADATPLVEELKKHNLTLQDVYLTHTHIDHVTELDRLLEKAGGSVGVHTPEAEPIGGAAPFQPGVTFSLGKLHIETRDTSGHSAGGTTYHIHGLNAPLAIVGDAHFDLLPFHRGGEDDFPGRSRIGNGVFEQVQHDLLETEGIDFQRRQTERQIGKRIAIAIGHA